MRKPLFAAALAVLFAAPLQAQTPADPKAALADLSAEDFPTRQQAIETLQKAIAEQTRQMLAVQSAISQLQQTNTRQMKQLMLLKNPEAHGQAAGLLEMQLGLTRWAIEVMKLPAAKREPVIAWGLAPENAPLLARAFSRDRAQQAEAIAELGKLPGDAASWTLAQLILAPEASLSVPAMAAVWNRTPTEDLVDSLWFRACSAAFQDENPVKAPAEQPAPIRFPDESDPVTLPGEPDNTSEFSNLALKVLLHYNSPLLGKRIVAMLQDPKQEELLLGVGATNSPAVEVFKLIEVYRLKEAVPLLIKMAHKDNAVPADLSPEETAFCSDRTAAIGLLAQLTGQKPEDYKLKAAKLPSVGLQLWAAENLDDEAAAIQKIHAWWQQHHAEYNVADVIDLPHDIAGKQLKARKNVFLRMLQQRNAAAENAGPEMEGKGDK